MGSGILTEHVPACWARALPLGAFLLFSAGCDARLFVTLLHDASFKFVQGMVAGERCRAVLEFHSMEFGAIQHVFDGVEGEAGSGRYMYAPLYGPAPPTGGTTEREL